MARQKKPVESVRGTYSAMPHAVMDSPAYIGASVTAKALLCELIRQHNGGNNGRLHLSRTWLAERGWRSRSIVDKARAELIERRLILETRPGGLGIGPSWYALTWLPITNHLGLETAPNTYHPGGWQLCGLPRTSRRKPPMKNISQPDHRAGAGPTTGPGSASAGPTTGPISALSGDLPGPTTGHDVLLPLPPTENLSAVETFTARIGGRLTVPKRDPNPLGRSRHIRLFKATRASMGAVIPTPASFGHNHAALAA